jgi:hypothetical protein
LEKNPYKIDWFWLSDNPNAISLLEKNPDKILKIQMPFLYCKRIQIKFIGIIYQKIQVYFEYDYFKMKNHFLSTYGKELIQWQFHPINQNKWDGWIIE